MSVNKKMKADDICRSIDIRIRPQAITLTKQILFMAKKLEETQKKIKAEPLVVEYDNGGGQTGSRENPSFTAYEKLLAAYTKSLSTLKKLIGDNAPAEINTLDNLRSRFKVQA